MQTTRTLASDRGCFFSGNFEQLEKLNLCIPVFRAIKNGLERCGHDFEPTNRVSKIGLYLSRLKNTG